MLKTLLNKIFRFDEFAASLGRNIKDNFRLVKADYFKVRRIIKSCQCEEHLDVANRVITRFYMKHGNDFLLKNLEKRYRIKKRIISKA
tara:strand:- start:381 stop:644 length:264 start_codon:yes stop_codon:yes gene_type:complete